MDMTDPLDPNMCSTCDGFNDCTECVQGAVLLETGQSTICVKTSLSTLTDYPNELGTDTPDDSIEVRFWANGPYASTWRVDPTDITSTLVSETWWIAYLVKGPRPIGDYNALTGRHDDDDIEMSQANHFQAITCEPGYTVIGDYCEPCETDEENECYSC